MRRWLTTPFTRVHELLIPTLVTVFLTAPGLFVPRFRVDTGLYAAVSLNAWRTGDWLTLRAGEELYFNKPPLVFWMHAVFMGLFGKSLPVIKLPVVLAAIGCVVFTVLIARRLAGRRTALVAGLVLALTPQFPHYTHRIILDYHVLFFMLGAVWCVSRALRPRPHLGARPPLGWAPILWVLAAGVPVGLAMLVKPVFPILTLPFLAVWLLLIRQPVLAAWTIPAAAVAAAVAAPWHIAMYRLHGDVFLDQYFGSESIARATGGDDYHPEPWWWYFAFLARSYWPWMIGLAGGLVVMVRRRGLSRDHRAEVLAACWIVAWLIVVSVFADKRDRYIFHLYPFLAMLVALWLTRWSPHRVRRAIDPLIKPTLVAAFAVGLALTVTHPLRLRDRPEWTRLDELIRERGAGAFRSASLNINTIGSLYVKHDAWIARAPANPATLPPGTLVIYHLDRPPYPPIPPFSEEEPADDAAAFGPVMNIHDVIVLEVLPNPDNAP